jgi:hypothetical protein
MLVCLSPKEADHGRRSCSFSGEARPPATLEQRQDRRRQTTAATKPRLVDPDQAADRGRKRDLALFNLAIDSKLRGCDLVAVRVDDVAPSGYAMDRATIRQKKTGRHVRFELTIRRE